MVTTVPPLMIRSTLVFLLCAVVEDSALTINKSSRAKIKQCLVSLLCVLRVSVVISLFGKLNHGDTEHTEIR